VWFLGHKHDLLSGVSWIFNSFDERSLGGLQMCAIDEKDASSTHFSPFFCWEKFEVNSLKGKQAFLFQISCWILFYVSAHIQLSL
jgi:hypothetical protein